MITIKASAYRGTKEQPLPIGRLGENEAREVEFDLNDLKEMYGEGTWKIAAKQPYGEAPYLVGNYREENQKAIWTITINDAGVVGYGLVELRYYPESEDDALYKSQMWVTKIEDSLYADNRDPSPYNDVLNQVAKDLDSINGTVKKVEDALTRVEGLTKELTKEEYDLLSEEEKENGTIYLITDETWDAATQTDVDSGSNKFRLIANDVIKICQFNIAQNVEFEGDTAGYTAITTLPVGYTPVNSITFPVIYGLNGDKFTTCVIKTTGEVGIYITEDLIIDHPVGECMYFYTGV